MKSTIFTKLIHYLFIRDNKQGFRWWELLLVIFIGILAAIALPSFLSSARPIKSSEVKTYIGSINRGQQAYFLESNDKFSSTIIPLGLGIKEETELYKYSTIVTKNSAFNYGIAKQKYVEKNWLDKEPLYSFVGAVFAVYNPQIKEKTTISIICKNELPGIIKPNHPTLKNSVPICGNGTKDINKQR